VRVIDHYCHGGLVGGDRETARLGGKCRRSYIARSSSIETDIMRTLSKHVRTSIRIQPGTKRMIEKKQFTEFHRKIHVYMCMLNRCLEWYKWLNSGLTHLFHRRTSHQWCMLFVAASAN